METTLADLTGAELYEKLDRIKKYYLTGIYSYSEAIVFATPVVAEMNVRGKAVAKKHNKAYRPITVGYVLR